MSDALEALRGYVHFLHEREGVRQVKLSLAARQGLAKLAGAKRAPSQNVAAVYDRRSTAVPSEGSRRPPGEGAVAQPPPVNRQPSEPVARRSMVTTESAPALEISGSTKVDQLAHLAERASVCVKCPHLVARRHTVVFGVGNPDAKLMFIGEAPGEEEDLQGEPFVGKAGQLLTKMIIAMGLTREEVYIANIVKCRPDMPAGAPGNRKPTKQEMDTCVPYLRAQIDVIKPAALVALGATAVEGLVGPVGTIGNLRGKFLEYRSTPLMPTYHPSYLLRNQSNTEKRKVWEDLLKVMERLELPITEKQRGFFLAK
jgi:uracil-DNA glycosylase family 4